MAEAGVNLILIYKRKAQLDQLAQKTAKSGVKVFTIVADLNNTDAIQKAIKHYMIHLRATWLLTHQVVQQMLTQGVQGSIINIL